MSTLVLLRYNNYYNRIVKREESVSAYRTASQNNGMEALTIQNVNFIPNDFVNTTQVVNIPDGLQPDYLLVLDTNGNITSRWFIVDDSKPTANQLRLTLHRDLMADYYDTVMNADTFIEKGFLKQTDDLIFNSEDMTFNQVKQSDTLLFDKSGCPWVCVYAASHADNVTTTFDLTLGLNINISETFTWSQWQDSLLRKAWQQGTPIYTSININSIDVTSHAYTNDSDGGLKLNYVWDYTLTDNFSNVSRTEVYNYGASSPYGTDNLIYLNNSHKSPSALAASFQKYRTEIQAATEKQYNVRTDSYTLITRLNNQYVQVTDDVGKVHYYRMSASPTQATIRQRPKLRTNANVFWTDGIRQVYQEIETSSSFSGNAGTESILLNATQYGFNITFDEVFPSTRSANIGVDRYHLNDAPYDMFCMPYSDTLQIRNTMDSSFVNVTANKTLATQIARALIEQGGDGKKVYDAQILPYCPIRTSVEPTNNVFDLADSNKASYTPVTDPDGATIGYIFHAQQSYFTTQIDLAEPITIDDYKIQSQTEMYRLVSPNFAGMFEFNAAKNGGVDHFNVVCTYKPFTPYIKVYPNWGRLYGSTEFNDARGLICGGDFSLPMTSSAWATYELNNKNYLNSFDRQIQNLEVNNSVQRERERWQVASSALGAAGQGASSGMALTGNPLGALAGVGTGILSGMAGARDISLNERLRSEALDYTKDQFGYALGNIKALPNSLARVSSFNDDNKYVPFLEKYSATEKEIEALQNKIKYNGMTVMVIGKIQDFLNSNGQTYVKGQFIRAQEGSINADYHITKALADELYKGVFI